MDGDTLRPTVAPQMGDVTITEFMANPDAVSDSNGEWFEIHFAQAADLNGLQLGKVADPALMIDETVGGTDCISVAADTYVVFARNTDTATNGGLPTTDIVDTNISLTNSSGSLFVAYDNVLFDTVEYSTSQAAGVSTQIDDVGTTCAATTAYGDGDLGTPGAANPLCQ
jgi:hypothetical protein